jgi:hypothetical protein
MVGVTPPAKHGGQHHRNLGARSVGWTANGDHNGETVRTMNAIVNGARSRSTVLTGAAGLLLLATAVVMMVCAAPRLHGEPRGPAVRDQLSSWVWVAPGHWKQVTPATVGQHTRTHRVPVP